MKSGGLSSKLVLLMPLFCVAASSGIVIHQTARRDRLAHELAASKSEYEKLEQKLTKLKKSSGGSLPATGIPEETSSHHHHDGDEE